MGWVFAAARARAGLCERGGRRGAGLGRRGADGAGDRRDHRSRQRAVDPGGREAGFSEREQATYRERADPAVPALGTERQCLVVGADSRLCVAPFCFARSRQTSAVASAESARRSRSGSLRQISPLAGRSRRASGCADRPRSGALAMAAAGLRARTRLHACRSRRRAASTKPTTDNNRELHHSPLRRTDCERRRRVIRLTDLSASDCSACSIRRPSARAASVATTCRLPSITIGERGPGCRRGRAAGRGAAPAGRRTPGRRR